jgi:hypothetical protein
MTNDLPLDRLAQPPTAEDVRLCYRLILGREPESEDVVERHVARAKTVAMLRRSFIGSREFISRNWQMLVPGAPRIMPPVATGRC